MKLLLDTCVLYPTVMREMLLGVAAKGLYTPLWSERILGEWQRAAVKLGPAGVLQAEAEITMVRAGFPTAVITANARDMTRLWLPDEADVHVLAAAIAGHADAIVTLNNKDFPRHTLQEEGLDRLGPDQLLYDFWLTDADVVEQVAVAVLRQANHLSDRPWTMRALLKKARLPRSAKALQNLEAH